MKMKCDEAAVYLTIYSGDKLPPFYIGSTFVSKIDRGYRGSVTSKKYKSLWDEELKNSPANFQTVILSRFNNRKSAFDEEVRLQKMFDVVKSDLFINKSIAAPNGFFGPSQRGVKKTKEHSEKISNALKGKSKSEEAKKNLRIAQLNRAPTSESAFRNMSLAQTGANNSRTLKFSATSPKGEVFVIDDGLRRFCNSKNLSFSKIFRFVNKGRIPECDNKKSKKAKECTGWTIGLL